MFGANSVADDIDDTAPLWAAVHGRTVPRTVAEMAGAVASMLRLASKVIFVDPYVAAERPRQCEAVSLDRAQYEQRWRQYAGDPPAFEQPEGIVIIRVERTPRVRSHTRLEREAPCDAPESI